MKKNMLTAGALALVSAVIYFASMAGYAFPGESAKLQAVWKGLDFTSESLYPLMSVFAKLFGGGNLLAPVCGVLAVVLVYLLTNAYLKNRVAGVAAAFVFMLTPGVREAASHLEPRLFDAVWALALFALAIPYAAAKGGASFLFPVFLGVMAAFGFTDSSLFIALFPLVLFAITSIELGKDRKPYLAITLFTATFILMFFVTIGLFDIQLTPFLKRSAKELKDYYGVTGWMFVAIFSTLPFITSVFSSRKAFEASRPALVDWVYHAAVSFVVILAVATPLSPSSLLAPLGIFPVVTSAFTAMTAGYAVSYWWKHRRLPAGIAAGSVLGFVIVFASLWNLFTFERDRGAFADETARKVIADLGDRSWLVTDGTLDDHLRLVAAESGRELNLIALQRDLDAEYLARLGRLVADKKIGGSKNDSLTLSLSLGVLPFVQDWFASDPTVAKEVAIWGAPDIWYSSNHTPVPEFLFFGADEKVKTDWKEWDRFNALLEAPKGWGSYRIRDSKDPVEKLRLTLRRHLGFVANNRGVYLQDKKDDDGAFEMYELVLNSIDNDNVCALFNEIEMSGAKYAKALAKKRELERRLKDIVDDKDRRYVIWRLGSYYGYVRNPDMFVRLGFAWARSGRPGDALAHIRRAIDFVPTDKRATLLNMMAALYANEADRNASRRIYQQILSQDAKNHDALIGMMRLELMDGDHKKALEYLEKAAATAKEGDVKANTELAMIALMKNDFARATELLRKVTDAYPKNLQAWSLTAAVLMQEYDAVKEQKRRTAIVKEIEEKVLPAMERQTTNPYDYYLQITKAFLLMRKGEDKRREARDAFIVASKARPDSQVAHDIVLGLDISLDDRVNAEEHAKDVLRKNRNAPLANYVMGSIALGKGEFKEAEQYLRRAVNVKNPYVLAMNDIAETFRRLKNFNEAEMWARKTVEKSPEFYIGWETLGSVLLDAGKNTEEAQKAIEKSISLSKDKSGKEDVRLYTSLARVQILRKDMKGARASLRKVKKELKSLTDFERREYEEIEKRAK